MSAGSVYEKIDFTWDEPQPLVEVPRRLTFRPVESAEDERRFLEAVTAVLWGSLDRGDQHAVATQGLEAAARSYLEPFPIFAYERRWWHLAYDANGELVGFTQPVTYVNSDRDDRAQATIHYIGVLPSHRGHRYIDDLLRYTTRTLQEIGVWRIFTDTGTLNAPMIAAFERAGYQRGATHEVPLMQLRH